MEKEGGGGMLLGKRRRRPISRTCSVRELSSEAGDSAEGGRPPVGGNRQRRPNRAAATGDEVAAAISSFDSTRGVLRHPQQQPQPLYCLSSDHIITGVPPGNPPRRSAVYALKPAQFMGACGFCKRRLGPGRDTYMYRGEAAFCSLECRQQWINLDEVKEKRRRPPSSDSSGDGETVTA